MPWRKHLKKKYEGEYPDMPKPVDRSDPLPTEGFNEDWTEGTPDNLDAETHLRLIREDLLRKAPKSTLDPETHLKMIREDLLSKAPKPAQAPAAMEAPPSLEEEEGDGDPGTERPMEPGLLDDASKLVGTLKDRAVGLVNKLGRRTDVTNAGKAARTVQPPPAKAASRFDAALKPGENVGIGDRNVSLMEDAEPGIGLELTSDRGQTLMPPEEPTAQEQMPEQAQVPNKQLAQAVNGTSAVSSNQDAMKALQREKAPEDQSAFYAALKTMANASGRNEHGTGFYDAKIAQEKQKQKDWQARLAQELRSKYQTDQMKEKQREFDLKQEENRLKAEELKNRHQQQLDMQEQRLASGDARAKAIQDRFNETKIQKVVSEMPQPRTVDAFKRLQKRLEDPTEIQGWDTAKTFDKAGRVSGVLSPTGIPFQIFANEWRKGTEAEGMMQDVMAIFQGISLDTSGKVLNEQEMANVERRLGVAAGQSQAAFRNALRNELSAVKERVDLYIRSQSPEVQAELDKRGVRPNFEPAETTGYAPRQHLSMPTGARIKREVSNVGRTLMGQPEDRSPVQEPTPAQEPQAGAPDTFSTAATEAAFGMIPRADKISQGTWWLKKLGAKLGFGDSGSVSDAVEAAKAQEDEETRKRLRDD